MRHETPDELKNAPTGWTADIVKVFLTSKMSVLLIIASLVAGAFALLFTPREEDPQIIVPVIDVAVAMPGASVQEIERLAATPLETILKEIPGVENVYTMARPGSLLATVRFYVGQDREQSLTKVFTALEANRHRVPPGLPMWQVTPVDIDDVPILSLTLYARDLAASDLRRIALELQQDVHQLPDIGKTAVVGGERREVRLTLDPARLAAHHLTPLDIAQRLPAANLNLPGDRLVSGRETAVYAGPFLRRADDLRRLVVAVNDGKPVYLEDVADITDGIEEPLTYTRIGFGPGAPAEVRGDGSEMAAVTLTVAKRKGANAVGVADRVLARVAERRDVLIPSQVQVHVARNYGETANHKVNELVLHLSIAVGTIIVLLGLALGWREALVVALAVPITLAVTLLADLLFGYTINRVTLFALILSLGLLVDDPIVDVENIYRHFKLRKHPPLLATLVAVDEIRPPTILATFTVIVSFLPMFFITGMMGPYMAPMAFNVPMAMLMSLFVAFTITPWAAYHALRREYDTPEPPFDLHASGIYRLYRTVLGPLLAHRGKAFLVLGAVALAFLASLALAALGYVPLKMLPFDNKNELQLVIETPEGTTPEQTDAVVSALGDYLRTVPEVTAYTTFTGLASPMDFNGLVRHYFLRQGGNVAEVRINLLPKEEREWQSHAIGMRLRPAIEEIGRRHKAIVKIVEMPPGPPVLSSIVAEVYGPPGGEYAQLQRVAGTVRSALQATPLVSDVDATLEDDLQRIDIVIDKEKAALAGVEFAEAVQTARLALAGMDLGGLRDGADREAAFIRLRLPYAQRGDLQALQEIRVRSRSGRLVALGEIASWQERVEEQTVYHKDLRPVVYVYAEQVGISPVDAMFAARKNLVVPDGYEVVWDGEGEWKITVEVFRDLGLAFAAAMLLIYFLLVAQTGSLLVPCVQMIAIPLTMIGIFPGFWLLNLFADPVHGAPNPIFFTATGMIGMIALAGIVVRNSIILIDFIEVLRRQGLRLADAVIEAGAVRTRPILLTAAAALFGAWVIILDPIFSGLAWSFIFGIFASTLFTLLVIPLVYYLIMRGTEKTPAPAAAGPAPRPLTAQERDAQAVAAAKTKATAATADVATAAEAASTETAAVMGAASVAAQVASAIGVATGTPAAASAVASPSAAGSAGRTPAVVEPAPVPPPAAAAPTPVALTPAPVATVERLVPESGTPDGAGRSIRLKVDPNLLRKLGGKPPGDGA